MCSIFKNLFNTQSSCDNKCTCDNSDTMNNCILHGYGNVTEPVSAGKYKDNKNIYILLDNGHGENTPGKCSPDGKFREYRYTREIVNRLKKELEEYGYNAIALVPEEYDVSLSERVKRANNIKSNLSVDQHCVFISVHVNAAGNGDKWYGATGFSVYTTKGQNNSDMFATCIWDAAGEVFNEYDVNMIRRKDTYCDNDPDYEENFTVIYGVDMPAILTENFFMDNRGDVEFMETERGKEIIVEYHKRGIMDFIENMVW